MLLRLCDIAAVSVFGTSYVLTHGIHHSVLVYEKLDKKIVIKATKVETLIN
jgi:hypothetical protein